MTQVSQSLWPFVFAAYLDRQYYDALADWRERVVPYEEAREQFFDALRAVKPQPGTYYFQTVDDPASIIQPPSDGM